MSEILKEIKKLRKEVKEVKNILTDETSKKYVPNAKKLLLKTKINLV